MSVDGRTGLVAVLAFAVLYLFSLLVVAAPPPPDASAAEVQRYFVNHDGAIATSGWLAVVATVPFLVWLAVLRRRLAGAGWVADLAFGGGLVLVAAGTGSVMISLGLALHPDFNPPETVRVLTDIQRFFAPVVTGAVGALALAVAVASLRRDALPLWAGAASLVYAVYEVFESFTVFGGESGGFAPGESVNVVGTVAFLPWAVAIGVALARPYPRTGAAADVRQAD